MKDKRKSISMSEIDRTGSHKKLKLSVRKKRKDYLTVIQKLYSSINHRVVPTQ